VIIGSLGWFWHRLTNILIFKYARKPILNRTSNISFGTLRYGKLLEVVLYDCRRFADYKGAHAKIVPQWVEDWLIARTLAEDTTHFYHAPSLPFAYSSGKLGAAHQLFEHFHVK
jgi:hypothetical protein